MDLRPARPWHLCLASRLGQILKWSNRVLAESTVVEPAGPRLNLPLAEWRGNARTGTAFTKQKSVPHMNWIARWIADRKYIQKSSMDRQRQTHSEICATNQTYGEHGSGSGGLGPALLNVSLVKIG